MRRLYNKPWLLITAIGFIAIITIFLIRSLIYNADAYPYSSAVTYPAGIQTYGTFIADINGDSRPDMMAANAGSDNVSVYIGNGNGTFAAAVNYSVGVAPTSVYAADFDGDSDKDLVTANAGGGVSILINIGVNSGTFLAPVNYSAGSFSRFVYPSDFNGDGFLDLAVANFSSADMSILLGNGDGTFNVAVQYATGSNPTSTFVADFNGDLKKDVAVANYGSGSISIFFGVGDGTFTMPATTIAGISGAYSAVAADINNDGFQDLAAANSGLADVYIILGNGDGTFAAPTTASVGSTPISVFLADLNADSKIDLASANASSSNVSVLLGNGDGTFAAAINYSVGTSPYGVYAADIDGDTDYDLAVANSGSDNVSVLLSQLANPVPTLTLISPSNKTVGGTDFTLTLTGTNFIPTSVVRVNGSDRTTSFAYIDPTQVSVTIPASDLLVAGSLNITVFNPAPGGGSSGALPLLVNSAPRSGSSGISPASGSVLINNDAEKTNSREVQINITYKDATEITLSEDPNFTVYTFQPVSPAIDFTLSEGGGVKTVYAYLRGNGGVSSLLSDSIIYELSAIVAPIPSPISSPSPSPVQNLILNDPEPAMALPDGILPGTLIKKADLREVDFVDQDNRRHPFLFESVFFSWFSDFSEVKIVSSSQWDSVPQGSNVTVRPGTWLVKSKDSANVYAVEPYGALRLIINEQAAKLLYGDNWSNRVIDFWPEVFLDYQFGAELAGEIHPTGTLIVYAQDSSQVFYVENGIKRYVSEEVFKDDIFQDRFIVFNVPQSFNYAMGGDFPVMRTEELMTLFK